MKEDSKIYLTLTTSLYICTHKCAHLQTHFKLKRLISLILNAMYTWYHVEISCSLCFGGISFCLIFNNKDTELHNYSTHLKVYYFHLENMTFSPYAYKWPCTKIASDIDRDTQRETETQRQSDKIQRFSYAQYNWHLLTGYV